MVVDRAGKLAGPGPTGGSAPRPVAWVASLKWDPWAIRRSGSFAPWVCRRRIPIPHTAKPKSRPCLNGSRVPAMFLTRQAHHLHPRRFGPKQPNDDHDHRDDHDSDQQLKGGVQVHRPEPDCFVIKQPAACYFNEETLELAQMTGTTRLPGGEPRRASQKRTRRAGPPPTRMMPQWRMGDRVRWQDKTGHFHRELGGGHAEVTIANRVYRVRIAELRPG